MHVISFNTVQKAGAKYIPYWNWSMDATITFKSPVLSDEFFGSPDPNDHVVRNGAFANIILPTDNQVLTRDYPASGPMGNFYTVEQINNLLKDSSSYSQLTYNMENFPQ